MLNLRFAETDEFETTEFQLEYSLVSISKWEQQHEKPFFGQESKTEEETRDFIEHMVVGPSLPPDFQKRLELEHFDAVNEYVQKRHSGTWFNEQGGGKPSREIITSELVYYWMLNFSIPFQPAEEWNFNRLMNLIKICGIKQSKPKRMSSRAQMDEQRRINEARKRELGTSG